MRVVRAIAAASIAISVAFVGIPAAQASVSTSRVPAISHVVAVSVVPVAKRCGAPRNPYRYNYCSGKYIYRPASGICSYFRCIGNFWNGRGYVVQCRDGMLGKSGGIQGSCSYHGGNRRALLKR